MQMIVCLFVLALQHTSDLSRLHPTSCPKLDIELHN